MNNQKLKIKKKVKKHIPKDWLCELRILYRMSMETLNDIKRTGLDNIAIIVIMAVMLFVFAVSFRLVFSISSFAHELGNVLEISVYLKSGSDVSSTKNRIKDFEYVEGVRIVPKEVSWTNLKREMDLPDIDNPLPDTLHVKVDKPEHIDHVFGNLKKLSFVEDVSYAQEFAKVIQTINHVANFVTFFVVILMAVLTIAVINNTIQLVIQSRKDEIEIMRLMGVSNWYIRFPLIMQGAFYGFSGALIVVFPINFLEKGLATMHQAFMVPSPIYALNVVIIVMFLLGTFFGAGASFLCIKKHLQV